MEEGKGRRDEWMRKQKAMGERSRRWMSKRKREWMRRQRRAMEMSQQWMSRIRYGSAAARLWTQQHLTSDSLLVRILEEIIFQLLWLVEAIVIVASLCFFFFGYGFRL